VDETKASQLLAAANRVVDAAKVPDDLRATAFAKAVDLLADDDRAETVRSPAPRGRSRSRQQAKTRTTHEPSDTPPQTSTGSLDDAADTLKIDRATLDVVIGLENGQPVVHVKPSDLEPKAKPAMRQLILVLTAVRQAGGWDDQTDGDVLKKQLSTHHKGHYDSNNFWNAVGGLSDSIRSTGGKLKMIPAGFTAAATVITVLAGGGEKKK
jgi:hypothetical protein